MERSMAVNDWRISGDGAWYREARRLLAAADDLGLVLDDETLIVSDVYDLRAWRLHLQRFVAGKAQRQRCQVGEVARHGVPP